ncbi:MAG: response regulator [Planctomycetota bacterium]
MARILVIDDEPRLLRTIARFLEREGHEVRIAERYADLESVVLPASFDVLITDILMPGVSGLDVLERVREKGCKEPVVLMTGEPKLGTASEAVRLGAFDYVIKPVTKVKLLEAVSRALRFVHMMRDRDRAEQREKQLLENLASIGESAAMLTHEIKTPITNLNQALRAVADKLEVGQQEVLREMVDRLESIRQLTNRVLSFAKPLELRMVPFRLAPLLEKVCGRYQKTPGFQDVEIQVDAPDPDVAVLGDADLIEEVLVNLIQNSVEACDMKGRLVLSLRASENGMVTLLVEDDGPGISGHERGELFKLFHTTKSGGTGLGLALCRKIVESHGGRIEFRASQLGGAGVRIELMGAVAGE